MCTMMQTALTQKAYLLKVKKALEARIGRLTWDDLAAHVKIEPRALKAYRMPESSTDYRAMPSLARQALDSLLSEPISVQKDVGMLVAALSSLVISQAKVAMLDRQIISGLDWRAGQRNGLTLEERKIMALVSRFSLKAGLRDFGSEIHDLLSNCTYPLQDWLKIPELISAGFGPTVLIDPDYGIPTPEAQELASEFSTLVAHLEERLFGALKELLSKYPGTSANDYYTTIREFIVRNPVVSADKLFATSKLLPGALWMAIQQEFYESVPYSLASNGVVTLCAHCSSLMMPLAGRGNTLRCQTRACNAVNPSKAGQVLQINDAKRVKRGIHQYWVEPGLDEIVLFDALTKAGIKAELYPFQDRVDIAIGDIGLDLKSYVSPEILGSKFKKGLGGLASYATKWIVIPNWLVANSVNYLDRLRGAMGDTASRVQCYSVRDAYEKAVALNKAHNNA
jgi:hypothetical protein